MKARFKSSLVLLLPLLATSLRAGDLDTIGVTLLSQVDPSLVGTGIYVAQPEAEAGAAGVFEVNPSFVGQPTNLFTWISSSGTAGTYPNSVGSESGHADNVAANFYGMGTGAAPGILHVDNYEADFFITNYLFNGLHIAARVVNQSFTEGLYDMSTDQQYDSYAATNNVLFLNGIATNNGVRICSPATCYNGIAVNVTRSTPENGPTPDGRSKPDIIAPGGGETSYSTPYVSGAAVVLLQAGLRGDGGPDTNSQKDIRLLKALLLNGAVKPADWTNGVTTPLDARYGAGTLNVFNSWTQLKGGKNACIESTSVTAGNPHPPGANTNNEPALVGWNFTSITNSNALHDRINHYYFNLLGKNPFTLTSTLVWNRPAAILPGQITSINNLNLFLYNTANSNLVLCCTSMVDNVEHLYIPTLPPGRYDLQVEKNGSGEVSMTETYALAFEFFTMSLSISQTNTNAVITWPLAPSGFELLSTTNLSPPITWSPVANPVSVETNLNQNVVLVPLTAGNQFFRLQRP